MTKRWIVYPLAACPIHESERDDGDYVHWEDCEQLEAQLAQSQAESVKRIMRCPKCGSEDVTLWRDGAYIWSCMDIECESEQSPLRETPLAALLAWHGLENS